MSDAGIEEWLILTGRLHPLVVHLPVGILFLACIFELLTIHQRFRHLSLILPLVWLTGCAFAVVACVTGLILSNEGGYDDSILSTHQWLGISVAVVSAAGYWVRSQMNGNPFIRVIVPSAMLILIMVTGHYGGSLTHGEDYLSQPLAAIFGISPDEKLPPLQRRTLTNIEEAIVYDDVVYPILYDKCVRCHHAGKRKGKLNLAGYDEMMVGGKSGKVLIPGSPMTSELFKRIMLPEDDKKHMPPRDKPQLSKEEADIIHWWINAARASATVRLSDVEGDEAIQTVLATWYAEDSKAAPVTDPDPLPDLELPEVSADVVDSLEKNGFVVSFIVQGKPFISINCVNIPDLTDEGLARLLPVKNHILWLNASDTKVTDTGMALIGEMTNLLRLNVANTRVTSDGLSRIRDITGLRNLNLVGTAVSDDAVPVLEKMASLNTLYLWKTRISSKGIQHLQSVLPNTSINAGESRLP